MTLTEYSIDRDENEECICQKIYSDCDVRSNLKCSFNVLIRINRLLEVNKWDSLLSSKFLKIRHNLFSLCFMSDNSLEYRGTDYCLRNIGVDSDLSPDIYLGEESGVHKFIEFFVSANPQVALENKKQKYGKIDGINVLYIYYDMKLMNVFSDPDIEVNVGYNTLKFTELIKRTYSIDRYICYDSSELEISPLTPGKSYKYIDQRIYYTPVYNEYTGEEYGRSVKYLLDKLETFPEESKCNIYFDCKTRRFSIKKGTRDVIWMSRAIRDPDIFKDIVIYENYDESCQIIDNLGGEEDDQDEMNIGEGHSLIIHTPAVSHKCLENAASPAEIHDQLKNLDFDGLYKKKLTSETVIRDANEFYESWKLKCSQLKIIKKKMTTMLPLPDPDLLSKNMDYNGLIRSSHGWIRSALIKMGNIDESHPVKFEEIDDKEIGENYKICRSYEDRMKVIRKGIQNIMGVNKMSYRIMLINQNTRECLKTIGRDWSPEELTAQIAAKINDLSILEKEYCLINLRKLKLTRKTRKMMKIRSRSKNTFTMSREDYREYKDEVEIFLKKRKKGDERMGMSDYNDNCGLRTIEEMFKEFWEYVIQDSGDFEDWYGLKCTSESFPDTISGGQSKDYYSFYSAALDKIKRTRIYRIILWISNLCKSIWAISMYKTKKRVVVFDKIGTKNSLLFVCSTGNVQKFKSSKAFKILIPVTSQVKRFCGYGKLEGHKLWETDDGREYLESHWAYLKVQHLKYFMELPGRWIQTIVGIMSEYNINRLSSELFMYLTYCMLNARRKNENLLHDLKYMTYNLFGIRGCYTDLLEDKLEIPRDILERYIEEKFLINIERFVKSLSSNQLLSVSPIGSYPSYRLVHPLSSEEYGLDAFNIYVYSSYCFPKGVFTHQVEQSINMGSIMEIHNKAIKTLGNSYDYYTVKNKTDVDINSVFENDLYYNSSVVSAVGLYCEHYIALKGGNFDVRAGWSKIINSDITEYANSHGLRENDLSDSRSWGKKGHDVMTKFISDNLNIDCVNSLEMMMPKTIKEISKAKWEVAMTKYKVLDYSLSHPLQHIELNNANKVQWGGSREIYIMTMGAKNIQWSLEQMFGKIAATIDNELIHIPASDRFGQLYNSLKEPVTGVRYYLTLDCRKWAPLSNLNKYIVFVNSMSGILPQEFIQDFNYFFDMYYRKRLFFKEKDVKDFLKVNGNSVYSEFFVKCGCAYYIEMPYSFMMGMFNYLSSVLHAISQKYFEENIIPIISKERSCKIKMNMFAHSDDSGGYVEISGSSDPEGVLDQILREYEAFQKCLNHMLSLKKCTVGSSYFEITSYCFMKTDPMPVLPKFIFNHQINLTPSGYLADVKSISSSVVEMISNGSSFRTAFIKYILLGETYRRHTLNLSICDIDTRISLNLGGFPLIHPYYLCVYKSFAEPKWLSEFGDNTFSRNQSILENAGMVDPWGRNVGLMVNLFSSKTRMNDGRFAGYENLAEIPDDIIPSGHFACYMRKMCSKFYSDSMWFSMHDIDGTIIQSNMFNRWLSQKYRFLNSEYEIVDLISQIRSIFYSDDDNSYKFVCPDYIAEISENININKSIEYKLSDTRSKPSEMNTYYNKWWRNKTREIKTIALIKTCPWMGLLTSNTLEYMNCLESSENVSKEDIFNSLVEEEPLMRLMMTTRSESRLLDRFDTIGSWLFYNSYPGLQPKNVKKIHHRYNLPGFDLHPECISSILFESVCSRRVDKIEDVQIVTHSEKDDTTVTRSAMSWLQDRSCEDPIFMIVRGQMPSTWMNNIDFISIKNNQYSQYGRYWVGKTKCICRISQRSYSLNVINGTIREVRCKSRYPLKIIKKDMSTIDSFGFIFNMCPSNYKTQRAMRITRSPNGNWEWTDGMRGMPYYSDIKLDETIVTEDRLIYESYAPIEGSNNSINSKLLWSKFKLKYKESDKKKYRAYILHSKPCEHCLKSCMYKGAEFSIEEKLKYKIEMTREELINRWDETETYYLIYKEKEQYGELFSERAVYMGQIGTYLSAAYEGTLILDEQNYFTDYRGEVTLVSQTEQEFDKDLIAQVKSQLSKFVKIRARAGMISVKANSEEVKKIVAMYGEPVMSAALVLLPVERTINYYTPMTSEDFWYNNAQVMPNFMMDTLMYLYKTLEKQPGHMAEKSKRFNDLITEIKEYLGLTYSTLVRWGYWYPDATDIRLLAILRMFKDVGDPEDDSIDQRYFYDAASVMGCIQGWMRYIMCYSNRRMGELLPDHKIGYKKEYLAFLRKYKSFCQDNFQTTIEYPELASYRTMLCGPYYVDDFECEKRAYPLRGCDPYEFTQEEDYFDDEHMTYDREESMLSFNYDPKTVYDGSNESVFHEKGYVKAIRMCSLGEANNWVLVDSTNYLFELRFGEGRNMIGTRYRRFVDKNVGAPVESDLSAIKLANESDDDTQPTLVDVFMEELSQKEKIDLKKYNPLFLQGDKYKVKVNLVNSMLAKHAIFREIFDQDNNLTPIIEASNYRNIANQSRKLDDNMFNKLSKAELEILSAGMVDDMETDSFRLTDDQFDQLQDIHKATRYKNHAIRETVIVLLRSALKVRVSDSMCETTSKRIHEIIKASGYVTNLTDDEQIPPPKHDKYSLPHRKLIGV